MPSKSMTLGEGGTALVFEVAPTTAFGFGKGEVFSQTRWRFQRLVQRVTGFPDAPAPVAE